MTRKAAWHSAFSLFRAYKSSTNKNFFFTIIFDICQNSFCWQWRCFWTFCQFSVVNFPWNILAVIWKLSKKCNVWPQFCQKKQQPKTASSQWGKIMLHIQYVRIVYYNAYHQIVTIQISKNRNYWKNFRV